MKEAMRDKLIDALNGALKDQFDFVPLDATIKIADSLLGDGWAMQQWTSAKQHPKKDGRYYVTRWDYLTNKPFVDILWFERGRWWNRLHGGNYAVTHWMPLPSAAEKGK